MEEDFVAFPRIGPLRQMVTCLPYVPAITPKVLKFRGTVKLHGCNMAIVQARANGALAVQSRNRRITVEHDNVGSAVFVAANHTAICALLAKIRELTTAAAEESVVVFGEFAGQRVQSGVGIGAVPQFFAIFLVMVAGQRRDLAELADVHDNVHRLFNVLQFGTYALEVELSDPEAVFALSQELAEAVGADCPAARFLGSPGRGEGIVWTCLDIDDPKLWFKSKCKAYSGRPPPRQQPTAANKEELESFAAEFVDAAVTEARLAQGIDHLREFELPLARASTGAFVKWIIKDVLEEEGSGLTPKLENAVVKVVAARASAWFKKHYF